MADAGLSELDAALEQNEALARDIRTAAEGLEAEFRESSRVLAEQTEQEEALATPIILRLPATKAVPQLSVEQRSKLLDGMMDWDYGPGGVFARNEELAGNVLFHTTMQAVRHFDLCSKLSVDTSKLANWVLAVQRCMRPQSIVPYHNSMHACDVVHAAFWFMQQAKLREMLSPTASLAILMAACAHDCGHPGLNNKWFVKTESDVALMYHDRSVLENYHIHQAFSLMRNADCDVFAGMEPDAKATLKGLMTDAILATDLALHSQSIDEFKQRRDTHAKFAPDDLQDQKVLVVMTLKTSDIANPAKAWPVYKPWIDRLFTEFYTQGDKERARSLTPDAFIDRTDMTQCPVRVHALNFFDVPSHSHCS
eukprot:SAG31_NODE_6209_length_2120_cov_1.432954_1_plen_367_part_00